FQYSINGGTLQSAPLFNGVTAGTYVMLVQDANLCTYSETVVINGAPASVTPGVSITGSATSICAGEPVTFTATSTNGGANPQYQWTVNGANAGTNSATLTINPATNADVSVQLTSGDPCASPTTASSNVVSVTVNPSQSPAITITGNTSVDQGASSNITSSIVNGGTSPFYQWQDSTASHTWGDISGATNSSIDYSPQQTGDGLRAILTSTAGCTSSSTATSNALYFMVNTTSTPRTVLYPNPVHSILTIESANAVQWAVADILDDNGRRIFTYANSSANSEVRMDVSGLPAGIYFVRLIDRTGKPEYFKFVKQ
ncbi:MAG: T9SS type A sorting domain-containing protein, partial [Chitinophagaceae bacterium]